MTTYIPLVLASTSQHRRLLLERLRLPFQSLTPGVDEAELAGEAPAARAARLALSKARAVAALRPDAIVIGSDQVASLAVDGGIEVLHKPGTRDNCRRQLAALSGRTAHFDTAFAVVHADRVIAHADLTRVRFRPLDAASIESYLDLEPSFDCAGGFRCEGLGVTLFEWIENRDPTALVGLPLIALCGALRQLGVRV